MVRSQQRSGVDTVDDQEAVASHPAPDFDLLQVDGPSTATTLGRQIGQSTASVSYHLRVLAEHGYIVEVPERGNRRDRWWRATHRSVLFTFSLDP